MNNDFNENNTNNQITQPVNEKHPQNFSNNHVENFDFSEQNHGSYYLNEDISQKKKMDPALKSVLWIIGTIVVFLAILFLTATTISYIKSNDGKFIFPWQSSSTLVKTDGPTLNTVDKTETEGTMTAEVIYKKVAPSIVGVITYQPNQGLISTAGQGSGIIMTSDGYIITNAHVVGNTNKCNVTVVKDEKEYPAQIVGFDTRTDLAVLKVSATGLTPAQFGNSDELAVGEWVLAIGNPNGLENSLTRGLVSALNRSIGSDNSLVKFIQTDAAINPGNSGGALLNMYGQVVGINTSKVANSEGLGFSIPVNTAKSVVDDIIKNGYVSGRVRLGISVRQVSAYEAQLNDVPQGLVILEITPDSNISNRGIKIGDIITKINGIPTNETSALYGELSKHHPRDCVTLTIYRPSVNKNNATTFDTSVTLIEDKGQVQ